ncbi:MAG: PAS domain-containing protein, partial [Hymenobacter sp.]
LPERPDGTLLEHFPQAAEADILAYYRRAFETGEPLAYETSYQADGRGGHFRFRAQRQGEYLVVSFGDAAGLNGSPGVQTHAETERQRADAQQTELLAAAEYRGREREELYQVFEQLPVSLLLLHGPEHRIEYHNPAYQRLFPGVALRGRTIAESQPDSIAQGFGLLLDQAYQTGEPRTGVEVPYTYGADGAAPGPTIYLNFTYQPYRESGQVVGVAVFAFDVTEQVLARQQREAQQWQLHKLFEQAPVAIAIFRGPQYVIELANPAVCAIWGRTPAQAVGMPLFELLPEAAGRALSSCWMR